MASVYANQLKQPEAAIRIYQKIIDKYSSDAKLAEIVQKQITALRNQPKTENSTN